MVSHDPTPRFHDEHSGRRRGREMPTFVQDATLSQLVRDAYVGPSDDDRPRENPYALQPDTLRFLSNLLKLVRPRSVVEFGSGESTVVFASWAAANSSSVISVEHDRRWVEEIRKKLDPAQRAAVRLVHAPLRPTRQGLRQFLSYGSITRLTSDVGQADLLLLDGPHMSGREIVLYFVLTTCHPGALIVIDDFRHYAVFDMLRGLPPSIVDCFGGTNIEDNSHGLFVLRCLRRPPPTRIPSQGFRAVLRSYWRCLRDFRQYGTGD